MRSQNAEEEEDYFVKPMSALQEEFEEWKRLKSHYGHSAQWDAERERFQQLDQEQRE